MNRLMCHVIVFSAVLLLCSCAATQKVEQHRIFWPQLPDKPRIEFIGHYTNDQDLKGGVGGSWFDTFIGVDVSVSLGRPLSVASDGKGHVYVSDADAGSIYLFDFNSRTISKFGGKAYEGLFNQVNGVAVDDAGNAYGSDGITRKIYVVTPKNEPLKVLDVSAHADHIGRLAIDNINRHIVFTDGKKHQIVITDMDGKLIKKIGSRGTSDGLFNFPTSVAIEKDGGILVGDSLNARIQRFTSSGEFVDKFGKRGDSPGDFSLIKGIAVDSDGNIYVTDGRDHRVTILSAKGQLLMVLGGQFAQTLGTRPAAGGFLVPQGIFIDQNDRIYVADQLNKRFQVFQYMNERYNAEFPIELKAGKGVK